MCIAVEWHCGHRAHRIAWTRLSQLGSCHLATAPAPNCGPGIEQPCIKQLGQIACALLRQSRKYTMCCFCAHATLTPQHMFDGIRSQCAQPGAGNEAVSLSQLPSGRFTDKLPGQALVVWPPVPVSICLRETMPDASRIQLHPAFAASSHDSLASTSVSQTDAAYKLAGQTSGSWHFAG